MNLPSMLCEKTGACIGTGELLSPDCILTVACFTGYVSADTFLSSGFPTCSYASLITKINRLVKRGFLKPVPLPEKDGNILHIYRLTESGYSYASQLFAQDAPAFRRKKPRKDAMGGTMHDYSASLNFLPFLSLPFCRQLRAAPETSFLAGKQTDLKTRKALCTDVFFSLSCHDGSRQQVYVEEDLGTEGVRTLIKKLYAYEEQGFLGRKGHIPLFSFRKPYAKVQKSVFSHSHIIKLAPFIRGSLQGTSQTDVPDGLRETLSELKKIFPSSTDQTALMKFAGELQANLCPLRNEFLNRFHLSLFHARRNNMRDLLLKLPENDRVLRAICNGAAIGCGATPRITDAFPFLFYECRRFLEEDRRLQSYARYFPGLDMESYETVRRFSSGKTGGVTLSFRNVYSCQKPDGSRHYVAFEDISHDLGGILRCARMISSFSKESDPVSVVMNADSAGEAVAFATRFSYLYELDHPFPDRAFLYFTICADGKLYCATRDFDTGRGILRQLRPL